MRITDITKKRPARWPWALGAVLIILVAWGVTTLLKPAPDPEPEAAAPVVEDSNPPTAIPRPPDALDRGERARPTEPAAGEGDADPEPSPATSPPA